LYGPARLIWVLVVAGIAFASWGQLESHLLVQWTLLIVCVTYALGALGSAAWLSWLAALVPQQLRGRYFGIRNSAASLTCLISVPIAGVIVSTYPRGTIEGYGFVLLLGIIAGLVSLSYQWWMVDVDPRNQERFAEATSQELAIAPTQPSRIQSIIASPILQDGNFLRFLVYFGVWTFAVNLSAPFFNLYMLDNLSIDVAWVTAYNSLTAGANLVMMLFWGRLADRFGNRAVLLLVGILVAVTPLFWLATGANTLSVWLWLPLLHIVGGGTWAAIDLCNNNIQLGIASVKHQAAYFAVAAAIAGVSGALGTTAGGYLAQFADYGGIPGLFALSSAVRLVALLPLVFVQEDRGQSIGQMIKSLLPPKAEPINLQPSEEP
ncbi:MAG: MFS transporter, partial [Phormidesmis sp. CAN_BIN36]|nr:MFS transporter [Phormidesmis sp. CAN_BIN36]